MSRVYELCVPLPEEGSFRPIGSNTKENLSLMTVFLNVPEHFDISLLAPLENDVHIKFADRLF